MERQEALPKTKLIFERYGEVLNLNTDEVLFQQSDPSDAVYLIVEGGLTVQLNVKGKATPILLNYAMPGEIVGELGAVSGSPRTATLQANQPTTLLRLSMEQCQTLLAETSALAQLLMDAARDHLVFADETRANLGETYHQMQEHLIETEGKKEQLQQVIEMRDELTSMLIHDLRNPLGIIETGLELIAPMGTEVSEKETYKTVISLTQGATKRLRRLIDALLDIVKIEAGKLPLTINTINLSLMLQTLLEEQKPLADNHYATLVSQFPPELIIQGDAELLYRAIVNLVDNAIKFSPINGEIHINGELTETGWVVVSVIDQGPGVPEGERQSVFDRFTASKGGTGLGLTFSKMAIEAHGGQIWVEPGPENRGSVFRFQIPVTPRNH
ncbi:MAG: cyclic nucleotide-binding domain-containing protein [Anaerolineae bacterium]|nr:cyclic nucleotide-binding domain-containing protein [Anaerolineae bacterium]